jgi:type VI secretion system protein ImpH
MQDSLVRLQALQSESGAYDFFAALRLLECAHADKPRIGQSQRPQDDAVRFGQPPELAFTPSMLGAFRPAAEGAAPHLDVNFFGLMGANGPMPQHLTDYVRDRLRNANDPTLARFLDIFHHRMIALFYRAWASAQPTVSLDREHGDRFSDYLASLIGIGMPSLRGRDAVPDFAKLHYAGHLAAHNRNADGLAQLLEDFFKVPVKVEQFVGHWMRMPVESCCRLQSGADAQVLGTSTVLGTRVWNCQHKFRIVVGPLKLADYQRMLPGGDSFLRLRDWVRNYAGMAYDWEINVQLQRASVPPLALGRSARLGWTSWLHAAAPVDDARQLVLHPHQHSRSTPRTTPI